MNRKFLKDINIWGALLVSRCEGILEYSIPCLLKYCDKILLMQDNINDETKKIVDKYKDKYPNIIELAETGFPRATEKQETEDRGLFHRFKPLQGSIREKVFEYLREVNKNKKIDILIFPDSDEVFSDYLPTLLKDFWEKENMKAITMKPVDVYGDMYTIHNRSMTGHTRIMKFFPELTAIPYRTACYYRPLTKINRIGSNRVLIHLCTLTPKKMEWRVKHWKPLLRKNEALWKLPKDIREMDPSEIKTILEQEPDCTIEEYERGGDKRVPMGIENASNALKEATDLLDQLDVRYFLAFGTCLGLVRGSIIKWDFDVDLYILAEDNEKILNNKQKILDAGFTEFKCKQDIPKWKRKDGSKSDENYIRTFSFKKHGCRLDLDPLYLSKDEKYRCCLKGRKRAQFIGQFPKEWFDVNWTVTYRGKKYRTPYPVDEYLQSNYGETWHIPKYCVTSWNNRSCMKDFYELK